MVLSGGGLTPGSSIAADLVPSGLSWHTEGGVTYSDAVGRCLLAEGTGDLNCRRNPPKMILQLRALLQLKQYPLALPVKESGTTASTRWIRQAEGGVFIFGF